MVLLKCVVDPLSQGLESLVKIVVNLTQVSMHFLDGPVMNSLEQLVSDDFSFHGLAILLMDVLTYYLLAMFLIGLSIVLHVGLDLLFVLLVDH